MKHSWVEYAGYIKDLVYFIGSIGTLVSIIRAGIKLNKFKKAQIKLANPPNRGQSSKFTKEKFIDKLIRLLSAFILPIIIICASLLLVFLLDIVGQEPAEKSEEAASPTASPAVVMPLPVISNLSDAWLDELQPILPRNHSFFVHEWSKFDLIQVGDISYPHSIGVCIPWTDQIDYCRRNPPEEQEHSEYIEYLLSYKYKTLQFDFGIDNTSFPEEIEDACKCEFKVLVQSCSSKEYLGESDNILYDSDWINYRSSLQRTKLMDVTGCEAIRITVFWKFSVRQNGPIAFNLAIFNPILRATRSNQNLSSPDETHTKPDSIR